ncbi:MAG: hypothetical protein B0W54_20495 [Cellvibrio sp. 79]|nr:MAG: hypothetical protein B0W54_20495 [Cellvibrio sp. 79]
MKKLILITLFSLMASGCANTAPIQRWADVDRFSSNKTQFEGNATIYVFRDTSKAGAMMPFLITLDKESIGSIRRERYLAFPAAAGTHILGIDCPYTCDIPDIRIDADFTAGKSYYFVVQPDISFNVPSSIRMTTHVNQVDQSYAERLISSYTIGTYDSKN